MQSRREFIKKSCVACAGVAGMGVMSTLLSSCSKLPMYSASVDNDNSIILVPVSSFIEGQNLLLVRNKQLEYDILLIKKPDSTYKAFYMKCTHQPNSLVANSSGIHCNIHGSSFDMDGNVLKEPATIPLKKFKVSLTDNVISIDLKNS